MTETKNPLASKTIWGAILMLASVILNYFDLELSAEDQATLIEVGFAFADEITGLVGVLLAIWGRLTAKKPITLTGKTVLVPLFLCLALGLGGCSPRGHVATNDVRPVIEDDYAPLVDKAAEAGILTTNEEASHRATVKTTIRLLDAADGEMGGDE